MKIWQREKRQGKEEVRKKLGGRKEDGEGMRERKRNTNKSWGFCTLSLTERLNDLVLVQKKGKRHNICNLVSHCDALSSISS